MYKTILVHVDDSARSTGRVELAARLALGYEAHLIGVAMTGLPAYLFDTAGIDPSMPPLAFPVDELRAEAAQALDRFDHLASAEGVHTYERRVVEDEAGAGMCVQARYSDLVVISQSAPDEFMPRLRSDFAAYVLLNSPTPVLVLPHHGCAAAIGHCVTVAWNGSAEASRAITSALALLKRARRVDLVVLNPDQRAALHGEEPGADMALYLARHGIRVELSVIDTRDDADASEALLSFAEDKQADLLVMGAYGHSRLREYLLGGMTRTALASSPIALWMAH